MSLIEDMILEKFRELPSLPVGWYYEYKIEHCYSTESQVWEYKVTAIPVQRAKTVIRDINGKETILD